MGGSIVSTSHSIVQYNYCWQRVDSEFGSLTFGIGADGLQIFLDEFGHLCDRYSGLDTM
jgi:hypothetical protein